jgi:hypothetical protein
MRHVEAKGEAREEVDADGAVRRRVVSRAVGVLVDFKRSPLCPAVLEALGDEARSDEATMKKKTRPAPEVFHVRRRGLIRDVKGAFASAIEMTGCMHPDEIDDERARLKTLLLEVLRELRCT